MNSYEQFANQCASVAEYIEACDNRGSFIDPETGEDYFANVYGGTYYIGFDGEFEGVRVMVACGGPSIYIDTQAEAVEGYWGGDSWIEPITREAADTVNDYWREVWEARR